MKTVLCAIVKNEAPYIIEWIAYYKYIIGFDEILIYNNDSEDQTTEILQELNFKGFCKWKNWPREMYMWPQFQAYEDALIEFQDHEWICFLDLDEFLVLKKFDDINDCLNQFPNADSISFNWLVFGSSHYDSYSSDLVTKKFKRCSSFDEPINRHFKSIAKINSIDKPLQHISPLSKGRHFHVDGKELYFYDKNPQKIHQEDGVSHVDHDCAQVNHYLIKSKQEFKIRQLRGRVGLGTDKTESRMKNEKFSHEKFNNHLNEDIQSKITDLESIIENMKMKNKNYYEFIRKETAKFDSMRMV